MQKIIFMSIKNLAIFVLKKVGFGQKKVGFIFMSRKNNCILVKKSGLLAIFANQKWPELSST